MNTVGDSPSQLREVLGDVVKRPEMYSLREDDYRQAVAFMSGFALASPGRFGLLHAWSATRLRCVRENLGWPYALGVLARDRASHRRHDTKETATPLVREFLSLVCEYLTEVEVADGPAQIQARYDEARRDREKEAKAFAHTYGPLVNSPQWDEAHREWEMSYAPELRSVPASPWDPWSDEG